MPSAITHYLFAQQALDLANSKLKFLNDNIFAVNLGTQGPDPLFFYGTIPWKPRKNTKQAKAKGNLLHSVEVIEKFVKMISYAQNKIGKEKDLLFSYIFGHGLHYLLDREAHAYVFYMTGVDKNGELDKKYGTDHALFESMIDFEFTKYLGIATYAIKPHKTLLLNDSEAISISQMYASGESIGEFMFYHAWEDMKYLESFFLDKNESKTKILKIFGLGNSILNSMIHKTKKEINDKIDYLNLSNQTWFNPATNKPHQESFIDLFKLALNQLPIWTEIIELALSNKEYKEKLKSFVANRGYDGIEIGQKMLYHKSVYLKGE
jgi:hypothetical protein